MVQNGMKMAGAPSGPNSPTNPARLGPLVSWAAMLRAWLRVLENYGNLDGSDVLMD